MSYIAENMKVVDDRVVFEINVETQAAGVAQAAAQRAQSAASEADTIRTEVSTDRQAVASDREAVGLMKEQVEEKAAVAEQAAEDAQASVAILPNPFPSFQLINILQRNDFSQVWGGSNFTGMTVQDNVGTFTATARNGHSESPATPVGIGDKVYVKIDILTESNLLRVYVPGAVEDRMASGTGAWETLSFIINSTISPSINIRIRDTRSSGWTPVKIRKGVVINLTSVFGAGMEPSLEKLESELSGLPHGWFGDKHVYKDLLATEGMTYVNKGGVMTMGYPERTTNKQTVVCFGDSITEFGNYPNQLAGITGQTVVNVGIGGTRLTDRGDPEFYDDLTFTKLVSAIASGDFSVQDAAINALASQGDDNTTNYNALKSVVWQNVDKVVFMYGTNDYRGIGFSIGNDSDTTTYRNLKGGLNYVLSTFASMFPHIAVFAVTPIFRLRSGPDNSDDVPGSSGVYLYEVAEAIRDMAKKYHIPCLDLYNESGINKLNAAYYLPDGTHPNQTGYNLISRKIARFIEQ